MRTHLFGLLLAALPVLPTLQAQIIDTIGGTATAALRTNSAKASLYRVDSSVLITELEMYLDVPGVETLTFFSHRHHSRSGVATLDWTLQVQVTGGIGPAWYSTGPIALPWISGNHYTFGVSWPGSLTYYYSQATTGAPVSFGSWQRAHTLTNPLPPTLSIPTGVDVAQYRQRITTLPFSGVTNVGAGCGSSALLPRLVAGGLFSVGTTRNLDLVDATPNALGVFAIGLGPTLPVPTPFFGCSVWLNLGGAVATNAVVTSATGYAAQGFTVPNDPLLSGIPFSAQAGVLSTAIDFTNAIDFTTN